MRNQQVENKLRFCDYSVFCGLYIIYIGSYEMKLNKKFLDALAPSACAWGKREIVVSRGKVVKKIRD